MLVVAQAQLIPTLLFDCLGDSCGDSRHVAPASPDGFPVRHGQPPLRSPRLRPAVGPSGFGLCTHVHLRPNGPVGVPTTSTPRAPSAILSPSNHRVVGSQSDADCSRAGRHRPASHILIARANGTRKQYGSVRVWCYGGLRSGVTLCLYGELRVATASSCHNKKRTE
jgi:hypothetical protein